MKGHRLGWLAIGLLLGLAPVGAQGYSDYRVVTYDIRTLATRPGVVYISPNYLTVLEFGEVVDQVATSQVSAVQMEASENLLILRSRKKAGSTDLVVRVGTRVALFRLVVDTEGVTPRRYVINMPRPNAGLGDAPAVAGPNFPSQPMTAPQTGAVGGGESSPSASQPTPPSVSSSRPVTQVPAPAGEARGLPSWLRGTFTPSRQGENLLISFQLSNSGNETVSLRPEDLVVRSGANGLNFRLVRTAFGKQVDFVAPGETVAGMIIVPQAPEGVSLEWKLQGTSTSYSLQTALN